MKETIIVVSCGKAYSFTPEGQTNELSGCTMHYLMTNDINVQVENDVAKK